MIKEHKYHFRIKEVRAQLGLTQREFAQHLLITRDYLAQLETGAKIPSARIVASIEALAVRKVHKTEEAQAVEESPLSAQEISALRALIQPKIHPSPEQEKIRELESEILRLKNKIKGLRRKPTARKNPYPGMNAIEIADQIEHELGIPPDDGNQEPSSGHRSAL